MRLLRASNASTWKFPVLWVPDDGVSPEDRMQQEGGQHDGLTNTDNPN